MLTIESLRKEYAGPKGAVCALDDVSLEARAGEFVAVRGASGCGKTTLLLAVGGLLMPSSGRITVDGQDPFALSPNERALWRARTVGFVFQQFHLVPYLDMLDNVLAASLAMAEDDARDRALGLLERFGLADRQHHVPAELSTGERQRTALVRALLNRPKLLLADEPTGNLDEMNADVVLEHLAQFAQEGGAVLLVTHDSRAAARADRTLHMAAGALANVP